MEILQLFKAMVMAMLLYSVSINLIIYAIPDDAKEYVTIFNEDGNTAMDIETISEQVQGNLQQQTTVPIIDVGALVFYSGNFIIDLMLNFFLAIPQMFGFIIAGISVLFGIDTYITHSIEIMFFALFGIMYLLGIISLVLNIRSGRVVA